MWSSKTPTEEGWYWVIASGQLTGQDYTHPVHVYKTNKKLDKPDCVFSDGENFSIDSDMFREWYSEEIPMPAKEFASSHCKSKFKVNDKVVFTESVDDFGAFCPVTVPKDTTGTISQVHPKRANWSYMYETQVFVKVLGKLRRWQVTMSEKYLRFNEKVKEEENV